MGPSQIAVETKGGVVLLQWALPMVMEAEPNMTTTIIDDINAYGEIEKEYQKAVIIVNPYPHRLLPLGPIFHGVERYSVGIRYGPGAMGNGQG